MKLSQNITKIWKMLKWSNSNQTQIPVLSSLLEGLKMVLLEAVQWRN